MVTASDWAMFGMLKMQILKPGANQLSPLGNPGEGWWEEGLPSYLPLD